MEDPISQELAKFDRNYENALERVVEAHARRGAPDEDPRELNEQLDILASGHVIRMALELMLLRPDESASLELDIQAADRVRGMLEQLVVLRALINAQTPRSTAASTES